jgi:hypothetical protein
VRHDNKLAFGAKFLDDLVEFIDLEDENLLNWGHYLSTMIEGFPKVDELKKKDILVRVLTSSSSMPKPLPIRRTAASGNAKRAALKA